MRRLRILSPRRGAERPPANIKDYKGLKKDNLRDNMTTMELALNMLAEATTAEISRTENPQGYVASANIAHRGGQIAGEARLRHKQDIRLYRPLKPQTICH